MTILTDIEDIGLESLSGNRENLNEVVVARVKHTKKVVQDVETESFVPGRQSVYIETWGCSHNNSDSEYMAGLLSKYGFIVYMQGSRSSNSHETCEVVNKQSATDSDRKMEADLWLLNSCTVKNPAEDHFRNMINEAKKHNKKVVVAGCVPQGQPKAPYLKNVSVVGVQQIDRVVEVVEETLKGNSVQMYAQKRAEGRRLGGAPLSLPKIRRNPLIEILAINTGCLNACTYCKTKHARGQLGSYTIEEVVDRAQEAFKDGCREVWLTSEDLGAYGRDIGTNLPALLRALVLVIPKGCMLRLGMTNPPYIKEHIEEIAEILKHPRVYKFIHIPVQSGSNNVLGEMRREYTREDFCEVVDTLYARLGGPSGITIATDVICGFPTETDADFEETFSLLSRYRFSVLFSNQFFPRPGTPAARMERQATSREVKGRTKRVHDLFRSYEPLRGREGGEEVVLVAEESSCGQWLVGHTRAYEQVLLPLDTVEKMGRVVRARITSTCKYHMVGEPLGSAEDVEEAALCPQEVSRVAGTSLSAAQMSRVLGLVCLSFVLLRLYTAFAAALSVN